MTRPYSPEEDNFIRQTYRAPSKQVAEQLQRTPGTIRVRRHHLGVKHRRLWTQEEDEALFGTESNMELALRLSRTKIAVRDRRRKLGARTPKLMRQMSLMLPLPLYEELRRRGPVNEQIVAILKEALNVPLP